MITDPVDNQPPQFREENYTFELAEDAEPQDIGSLDVTDEDAVTVEIGEALSDTGARSSIGDIFGFRSNTDILVILDTEGVLDREEIEDYRFTVIAEDVGGLTSTATVTVVITDVNDETPVITNSG